MPQDSNSIANQAIQLIGDNQPPVVGNAPNFDSSPAGVALKQIYAPSVAFIQKQFGWDASRRLIKLTASGNSAPFPYNYEFEYLYVPFALEIWQVQALALADPNDPLPTNWTIGNTLVSGVQTKVIWTDVADAYAGLNNNPTEAVWDPILTEAVVRYLASKLAEAIAGKPETEQVQAAATGAAIEVGKVKGG